MNERKYASEREVRMDSSTKRTFGIVFLTLFVDLLAFTLILPLLPKILDYYAANDTSQVYRFYDKNVKLLQGLLGIPESHNRVLLAGVLGSWFSLLQFISSPLLGALSDKFGRKSVLIVAMCGSIVSYAIWFLAADDFGLFALSRTIGGLSKANVGLSLAIISDVSDESSRGKGMAMVGSSFSLAFICGPSLGAYLSTVAADGGLGASLSKSQLIERPALIALALAIVNVVLVAALFRETNTQKRRKPDEESRELIRRKQSHRSAQSVAGTTEGAFAKAFHYVSPRSLFNFSLVDRQLRNAARDERRNAQTRILKTTGLIYFLYLLFYSGLEFTLSFLTHIRFGFSSADQGKLYVFSGLLMTLIQGGYIRRIRSGREPAIALTGLLLIVPSFIWMGLSTRVSHIYQALALYAISSAIVVPCLTTIVSLHSPVECRGVVMGILRSLGALARAIGPVLASLVFWTFGATACYVGGALALMVPLYLMKKSYKQMKSDNDKLPSDFRQTHDKIMTKPRNTSANGNLAKAH